MVEQPSPSLLNCRGDKRDSFFTQDVPENFCKKKPEGQGPYEHSGECDSIVYCLSRGRQVVRKCNHLIGFNSRIKNCDWAGFLRCVNINKGNISFNENNQTQLVLI